MSKYIRHPNLPKSCLISVRGCKSGWWFYTVRLANARTFWLLSMFHITVRRPWLSGPAKQLHPELFSDKRDAAQ